MESYIILAKAPFTNKISSYIFDNSVNDLCAFNLDFPSITFISSYNSTCQKGIIRITPKDTNLYESEFLWKNKTNYAEKMIIEMMQFQFFQDEGFIWSCWDLTDTAVPEHEEALLVFAKEFKSPFSGLIEDITLNLKPLFVKKLIESIVWVNESSRIHCGTEESCKWESKGNQLHILFILILLISGIGFLIFCLIGTDNVVHPHKITE